MMWPVPLKEITVDGVKTEKLEKFDINTKGILKGNGKDTVGEFTIDGKLAVDGVVTLDKTYTDGKKLNFKGELVFPTIKCNYKGADNVEHKLDITISAKLLAAGQDTFAPFDPIPEVTKACPGLTYDENGGAEKKGAWGVFILVPRKEPGKREGKVYFLDGKVVNIKIDITDTAVTVKMNDRDLIFMHIEGF
jgi:hypothetical protein